MRLRFTKDASIVAHVSSRADEGEGPACCAPEAGAPPLSGQSLRGQPCRGRATSHGVALGRPPLGPEGFPVMSRLFPCPSRDRGASSPTYPTRNFATLGPLELRPPFTGASVRGSSPLPLTFRHWAGVSPYTSSFEFAETCVFVKQSPGPFLCGLLGLEDAWSSHPTRGPPSPEVTGAICRVP